MKLDVNFCQSNETFSGKFGMITTISGATFTPHVSDNGVLSWTNDQMLPNPEPVKIGEINQGKAYYHTEREEVDETHENINTSYIYSLYRALMEKYPGKVKEQELRVETDQGTFINYEYVISTGERNTDGYYTKLYDADMHIKKPKYLVMSGIHGRERKTALSVYRFVCDLLSGHNVPKELAEGAIIHILPVANPEGFNSYTRWNGNLVDINRNFPHGGAWEKTWYDYDLDGETGDYHNGDSAASEMETKAIIQWLANNDDAQLFMDIHNSSQTNEIACIFGIPGNDQADAAKNIALRGIDRIIPYWRDVIRYPASLKEAYAYYEDSKLVIGTKDEPVIFAYSVTAKESLNSSALYYAAKTVGIPSIAVELSTYYGDWDEWHQDDQDGTYALAYHPESIAAGAEAVGNVLIEFYEQAFFGEVNENMKQIDSKLNDIFNSMPVHVAKGSFTPSADTGTYTIEGIPVGTKLVEIRKNGAPTDTNSAKKVYVHRVTYTAFATDRPDACKNVWYEYLVGGNYSGNAVHATIPNTNDLYIDLGQDGVMQFEGNAEYEWTAYCVND